MGFWHTGYMEFHEPTGLDGSWASVPPQPQCQHCGRTFEHVDALRRHRFESHPLERPMFFVSGLELGSTPHRITQPVTPSDFVTDRLASAVLNGREVSVADLPARLAQLANDRVKVELINAGVRAEFNLVFAIPTLSDLHGVEHCFLEVARERKLDIRAIEGFIRLSQQFTTATPYIDGICQYLYGVLAKERSRDSSLPHEAHVEKFSQAAEALAGYDRMLAHIIRALVAFQFNHFEEAAKHLPRSRLGAAAKRFVAWLEGRPIGMVTELGASEMRPLEELLTDSETSRMLEWTLATPKIPQSEVLDIQSLTQRELSEYDRVKLVILLAEHFASMGEATSARRFARELVNYPTTSRWADRMLQRLPISEHKS